MEHVLDHSMGAGHYGDIALILMDYVLRIDTPDGKCAEMRGTATNVIREFPGKGWRIVIANPQGTV